MLCVAFVPIQAAARDVANADKNGKHFVIEIQRECLGADTNQNMDRDYKDGDA